MAGTIIADVIQSDQSYPSSINIASPVIISNTFAFPAGTVSAPAFFPTGDTNTGIFFPAADTMAFAEGGVEAMRINSSGNVGIGTSSAGFGDLTVLRQATTATNATLSLVSGTSGYGRLFFGDAQNTNAEFDGFIQYDQGNRLMQFGTAQAERMRITSAGVVELTAGQLKFPATQNPSADANTLDDYEDGTWTPGISFGGASAGVTYDGTNTAGTYTKIGRAVFYRGTMILTNKGSSTGQVRITGLPFTSASNGFSPAALGNFLDVSYTQDINAYIEANTTTIVFWNSGSGNRTSFTNSGVTNSSQFMVSGVYFV